MAEDKRLLHFVVSLVAVIVCNMIIGYFLGFGSASSQYRSTGYSPGENASSRTASSGVMGEAVRQAELMDAASADRYDPPSDGELDEDQVEEYVSVMRKTRAMQAKYTEKLAAEMKAREEAGKSPSMADLGKIYSGAGGFVSANNAEMEVVKIGGGNWAKHEWVKQQLRVAQIQQGEGSDANAHNYELYQKYEEQLEDN